MYCFVALFFVAYFRTDAQANSIAIHLLTNFVYMCNICTWASNGWILGEASEFKALNSDAFS